MKITTSNKSTLQIAFSNPHLVDREQSTRFYGLLKSDIAGIKAGLEKAYGPDWFRFFLALKPKTLNAKLEA